MPTAGVVMEMHSEVDGESLYHSSSTRPPALDSSLFLFLSLLSL